MVSKLEKYTKKYIIVNPSKRYFHPGGFAVSKGATEPFMYSDPESALATLKSCISSRLMSLKILSKLYRDRMKDEELVILMGCQIAEVTIEVTNPNAITKDRLNSELTLLFLKQ